MIIVRPLVKEAPIDIIDGCPVPTLEKMLVDAISDKELQHLQGNELYTIYSNAFSDYEIKMPRLLRYAARRNRKQKGRTNYQYNQYMIHPDSRTLSWIEQVAKDNKIKDIALVEKTIRAILVVGSISPVRLSLFIQGRIFLNASFLIPANDFQSTLI